MTRLRWLCVVFAVVVHAAMVQAHSRGETWSDVRIANNVVSVNYFIQTSDLAQLLPDIAYSPDSSAQLTEAIVDHFLVFSGGTSCKQQASDFRQTLDTVEVSFTAECESASGIVITNNALFDRLPNHLHISQASINGQAFKERLFVQSDRTWLVTSDSGLLSTLKRYLLLGIEHIATGFDHLAFLFAVMLLTPRKVTLILMITGFTIGHSITLALAVLGQINVNSSAIEALIGFTIALVAAEVVARRHSLDRPLIVVTSIGLLGLALLSYTTTLVSAGPDTTTLVGLALFSATYLALSNNREAGNIVNPALTLLFGMIHGFGFAGLLLEIGLPPMQLLPALIGFNLGVEVGQLTVIGLVIVLALGLLRFVRLPFYTTDALASSLCGLGLFWFVIRSFQGSL